MVSCWGGKGDIIILSYLVRACCWDVLFNTCKILLCFEHARAFFPQQPMKAFSMMPFSIIFQYQKTTQLAISLWRTQSSDVKLQLIIPWLLNYGVLGKGQKLPQKWDSPITAKKEHASLSICSLSHTPQLTILPRLTPWLPCYYGTARTAVLSSYEMTFQSLGVRSGYQSFLFS